MCDNKNQEQKTKVYVSLLKNASNFSINMCYCCQNQVQLLAAQRPLRSRVGGKESLLYFGCQQLGEMMDRHLPKCDPLPPLIVGKSFSGWGRGLHAERVIWQSSWHWSLVVWSVSSWVQLIFSSRIGLLPFPEACSQNYGNLCHGYTVWSSCS